MNISLYGRCFMIIIFDIDEYIINSKLLYNVDDFLKDNLYIYLIVRAACV